MGFKIAELELTNFARVMAGMNRSHIRIDFEEDQKSKIITISGPNGSGKTTLFSVMHPYAYSTLDSTSNTELLINGMETGCKKITYVGEDKRIEIVHNYSVKYNTDELTREIKVSKISVNSFFKVNDEELNPNGNVTSFEELVTIHLHIEKEFLSLIRLGKNVSNFINYKDTQRKNFASKLMSELENYAIFYKNITEECRYTKALLKSVVEKINKLNVMDIKELENEISKLDLQSIQSRDKLVENTEQIATVNVAINNIETEYSNIDSKVGELEYNARTEIKKLEFMRNQIGTMTLEECESKLSDSINNIKTVTDRINYVQMKLTVLNDSLSKNHLTLNSKKEKMSQLSTGKNVDDIVKCITDIKHKIADFEANNKIIDCDYDDTHVKTILGLCNTLEMIGYEVDVFPVQLKEETISKTLQGINCENIANASLKMLDSKEQQLQFKLNSLGIRDADTTFVIWTPPECKYESECPYKLFYDANKTPEKIETESEKLNREIIQVRAKKDYYERMKDLVDKLRLTNMTINTNKDIVSKTNSDFINYNRVLDSFLSGKSFYDDNELQRRIMYFEEYKEYKINKDTLNTLEKELMSLESNSGSIDILRVDIEALNADITSIEKELNELRNDKLKNETKLNTLDNERQSLETIKDSITNINNQTNIIDEINSSLSVIKSKKIELEELRSKKVTLERDKNQINAFINYINDQITNKRVQIKEFANLEAEKEELEKDYDINLAIQKAVSTSKGIPLIYQTIFLRKVILHANELLSIVYGDELYIGDFLIDESNFKIPYFKNGMKVSDISCASDGEQSFLILALSCAFSELTGIAERFGIMMLDEVDGALDEVNSGKFLDIVERQTERMEQVFIISHKGMLESFNVDVLSTIKYSGRNNCIKIK